MSKIFKALERAEASRRTPPRRPSVKPSFSLAVERAERESEDANGASKVLRLSPNETPDLYRPVDTASTSGQRQEYEQLRVKLTLAASQSDLRSVLLVSTLSGEGVSTVTLGLATMMAKGAQQGVLVIALDATSPGLARHYGLSSPYGLSDLLEKEVGPSEAILTSPIPHLFFLESGKTTVDLSQPHLLNAFTELLADLRSQFDFILFDGSSLQRLPDALLVARHVDGVALIVQAERTKTAAIDEAVTYLQEAGANLLGVVLNRRHQYIPGFIARWLF